MNNKELKIPPHYNSDKVKEVWRVEYENIAIMAGNWAQEHKLSPVSQDEPRICLVLVDVQNTFCIPGFELFVGGSSGLAAVDDNIRLSEFIYRNLHNITQIFPTMDTHQAMHIFHGIFFLDEKGDHPKPYTQITSDDIKNKRWRFNQDLVQNLQSDPNYIEKHLLHYTQELEKSGKYELTIWPYHAMLGGIGHALVSSIEEAVFFHSIARSSQPFIYVKGDHPLTEHYSVLRPEVITTHEGTTLGARNQALFEKSTNLDHIYKKLLDFDALIIAGQAKSHCIAWTISDLLKLIRSDDENLAEKIYILQDCTSPIVVPGEIDFTEHANQAFKEFADAGMHIVQSTEPLCDWPGICN